MGAFYSISGSLKVKPDIDPNVIHDILDRAQEESVEVEIDYDEENSTIVFGGGYYSDYIYIDEFEDTVKELSPFVEDTFLQTSCDNESGVLFVGNEEKQGEKESEKNLEEILSLLPTLTEDDTAKLHDALAHPRTFMD